MEKKFIRKLTSLPPFLGISKQSQQQVWQALYNFHCLPVSRDTQNLLKWKRLCSNVIDRTAICSQHLTDDKTNFEGKFCIIKIFNRVSSRERISNQMHGKRHSGGWGSTPFTWPYGSIAWSYRLLKHNHFVARVVLPFLQAGSLSPVPFPPKVSCAH